MTKTELLKIMLNWSACSEAQSYVRAHRCEVASVIIDECDDRNWLLWLLSREGRLDRFIQACGKRIAKYDGIGYYKTYNPANKYFEQRALGSDRHHLLNAAYAASCAADAASYCIANAALPRAANKVWVDENAKQMVALRRIGRDWADGLPAARVTYDQV